MEIAGWYEGKPKTAFNVALFQINIQNKASLLYKALSADEKQVVQFVTG